MKLGIRIRAKIEANAELSKSMLGSELQGEDFAKKMVDLPLKASLKRFGEELQTKTLKRLKDDEAKDDKPTKKSGKRRKQMARRGLHINIDKDDFEGSNEVSEQDDSVNSSCLGQSKIAQDLVINKLQKKVKRLEKALRARTPGIKLFKIGTSKRKGLDKENVSKQGRKSDKTKPMFKDSDFDVLDDAMENVEGGSTAEQITTAGDAFNTASINVSAVGPSRSTTGDIFKDEMTTIADTLVAIRSARPRTTSVVIRNVEEETRRATPVPTVQSQDKGKGKMVEPEPTPKNPRKAQIQMDEERAQRLFEKEQAQFEREQMIARERAAEQEAKYAALIEQMKDVQARMDADELLAERLQEQERE
ncbi:hypothetical protein Tco_0155916 [Tanacetum coccineum]